jgi:hypothetical protein
MGFSESLSGTKMLRYAANYAARHSRSYEWQIMVTKNIYPEVAKAFNTTAIRVERNIRTAIKSAGYGMTNSEAIAQLAERAKEVEQDEDGVSA